MSLINIEAMYETSTGYAYVWTFVRGNVDPHDVYWVFKDHNNSARLYDESEIVVEGVLLERHELYAMGKELSSLNRALDALVKHAR